MSTDYNITTRRIQTAVYTEVAEDRFVLDVPSMGIYRGFKEDLIKWQEAGKLDCLARVADVYDGEPDKDFVIETLKEWPLTVLAGMCAEWDRSW